MQLFSANINLRQGDFVDMLIISVHQQLFYRFLIVNPVVIDISYKTRHTGQKKNIFKTYVVISFVRLQRKSNELNVFKKIH